MSAIFENIGEKNNTTRPKYDETGDHDNQKCLKIMTEFSGGDVCISWTAEIVRSTTNFFRERSKVDHYILDVCEL